MSREPRQLAAGPDTTPPEGWRWWRVPRANYDDIDAAERRAVEIHGRANVRRVRQWHARYWLIHVRDLGGTKA